MLVEGFDVFGFHIQYWMPLAVVIVAVAMSSCGDEKPMRVLAMLALALSLAGCNGDRMKDSMNLQPPNAAPLAMLTV
jgi:predicted small secreted protein